MLAGLVKKARIRRYKCRKAEGRPMGVGWLESTKNGGAATPIVIE